MYIRIKVKPIYAYQSTARFSFRDREYSQKVIIMSETGNADVAEFAN